MANENPWKKINDAFSSLCDTAVEIETPCLICGEGVPTSYYGGYAPKICEKCKAAVMKVRAEQE